MAGAGASNCGGDFNRDGIVDGADLARLLGFWGGCRLEDCPEDLTEDGRIDGQDLAAVLAAWGLPCGQ